MPEIIVHYPKTKVTLFPDCKVLAISGKAPEQETDVEGQLTIGGTDRKLLFKHCVLRKKGGAKAKRWVNLFDLPTLTASQELNAKLIVTGIFSGSEPPITFKITVKNRQASVKDKARLITIDASFEPFDEIPAEGFVAFGTLAGGHSLASATMNEVSADFYFDDPDAGFWCAQFPTLAPDTYYQLRALDSNDHLASVSNLHTPAS